MGLRVLEPPVRGADHVPDDVHLFGDRALAALADLLAEPVQDQVAGLAGLEALGVEHADRQPVVREVLGAQRHGHTVAGAGDVLAEDRVDQGATCRPRSCRRSGR